VVRLYRGTATPLGAAATAITAEATNCCGWKCSDRQRGLHSLSAHRHRALCSLAIVPGAQTATSLTQLISFRAIATTGTGATVTARPLAHHVVFQQPDSGYFVTTPGVITPYLNGATASPPCSNVVGGKADGTQVIASAAFTVALSATPEQLLALNLTPGTQSIVQNQSSQLIAIGTFSSQLQHPGRARRT